MLIKLQRLFKEALEIAFLLCNTEKYCYGGYKIIDLVNQIIPTAFILNTSYWVFYNKKLCVCDRFGITCPHTTNMAHPHCLDMSDVEEKNGNLFTVTTPKGVFPLTTYTKCKFDLVTGYMYTTYLLRISNEKIESNLNLAYNSFSFGTTLKYLFTRELEPEFNDVLFQPHPVTNPNYGEYVTDLLPYYYSRKNLMYMHCEADILPSYTFINAGAVDISMFKIILPISVSQAGKPKKKEMVSDLAS